MAADLPGFLPALVGVAQRGRSLGIHLVLATQRPAGVVSDEIRANTNLRIALRLQDRADAVDIVGVAEPAAFPRGVPGRAMLRLGAGETVVFQAAHSSGAHRPPGDGGLRVRGAGGPDAARPSSGCGAVTELAVLTRSIRAAASLCDVRPPFRPWLEPLPDAASSVRPRRRCRRSRRRPRRATPGAAALGVPGRQPRADRRPRLAARRRRCARSSPPPDPSRTATSSTPGVTRRSRRSPSCPTAAAVVGLHDAERRVRLVRFLAAELARRQADPAVPRRPIILAIDGLGALLAALAGPADVDDHARLLRVLTDGVAAGIHTVATLERPGGVSHAALAALTQRWLFHVDDPIECAALGVRAAAVPPPIPGRILLTDVRLEAQLAVLPLPPAASSRRRPAIAPVPIGTLGDDVDAGSLPLSTYRDGATSLSIGIDFATLSPVGLEVPDGEHVLVVGPARSGRSTALIRLIAGWRDAHRDGVVVLHCPRSNSPVRRLGRGRRWPNAVVAADEESIVAAACGDRRRASWSPSTTPSVSPTPAAGSPPWSPSGTPTSRSSPPDARTRCARCTATGPRSCGAVGSGSSCRPGADTDGDLFGEPLPRRSPVPPRPGWPG